MGLQKLDKFWKNQPEPPSRFFFSYISKLTRRFGTVSCFEKGFSESKQI